MAELFPPPQAIVLAHFIVSDDVEDPDGDWVPAQWPGTEPTSD